MTPRQKKTVEVGLRSATPADRDTVVAIARETLGNEWQAYEERGMFHVADFELMVAQVDGEARGFLAWELDSDHLEIVALGATTRGVGVGRALVDAASDIARRRRCRRLVVVTTDDNTDAQAFYEHLGFRVDEVREGAVDVARRLYKATIPEDAHDEIVYELVLAVTP